MSEHDTKAHSTFGGSSADRWMNCAGSTALIATVPSRGSSKYAAEGTAAHTLGETCLKSGERDARLHVGEIICVEEAVTSIIDGQLVTLHPAVEFEVTEEMAAAVNVYLDAVYEELALAPDAELYVEQRFVLPIDTAEPGEVFGSNDALVYIPSLKRLTIFDYKHGAGISVSADDNAQLKFYASGAALSHPDWPVAHVDLVIVQPRTRDAEDNDGGVKRWSMDPIELIEFAGEAADAIKWAKKFVGFWDKPVDNRCSGDMIEDADGKRNAFDPGKWCKWCDAASVCPARERQALQASALDYNDITLVTPRSLPDVKSFDTARLGQVLTALEMIEEWGKQVRSHVDDLLQQGVPVPGWKLVDKIGRRGWIADEQAIADHLTVVYGLSEDDVRPRKLLGITDTEKLLKVALPKDERKEAMDDVSLRFTLKASSGLTLVRDSDKREGVDAVARDFGSVQLPGSQ